MAVLCSGMDTTPPGKSKGKENSAERVAEAGAGSVPVVGAAFAVALVTALNWKLNQRRDDWLENLAEAVEQLGERVDGFDAGSLVSKPEFVDAVVSAVRTVEHTSQEEKADGASQRGAQLSDAGRTGR